MMRIRRGSFLCLALLLLFFPGGSPAAGTPTVKVFPSPRPVSFPGGFVVLSSSGADARVLKTVKGPASVTVAAYLDGNDGVRYFISDWSFDRYRKGQANLSWIRSLSQAENGPAKPGGTTASNSTATSEANRPGRILSDRERDALVKKADALYEAARYPEWIEIWKVLLGDNIARNGPNHAKIAELQMLLALHLAEQKEWKQAKLYYDAGAPLWYRSRRPGDQTIDDMAVLEAQIDFHLADYEAALAAYKRALPIVEKAYGANSEAVNAQRANIATTLSRLRRYAEAVPYLEEVYRNESKTLGENHPSTRNTLRELKVARTAALNPASSARETRDFSRSIRQDASMDPEKRVVAAATEAVQSVRIGEIDDALKALEAVIAMSRDQLGAEHPTTVTSQVNLAMVYRLRGDYAKAEHLWRKALEIRERTLGKDHPDVATVLNHLGALALSQRDFSSAEADLARALEIREARLGESHALTAESRNNLGVLYSEMERYDDAVPLLEKALQVFRANRDQRTIEMRISAEANLALCALKQGDARRARVELLKAAASLNELGEKVSPLEKADLFHNVGSVYHVLENFEAADRYLSDSIRIRRQAEAEAGKSTLELAAALNQAALVRFDRGNRESARELALEARQITDGVFDQIDTGDDGEVLLRFARLSNPISLIASFDDPSAIVETAYLWKNRTLDALIARRPQEVAPAGAGSVSAKLKGGDVFLDFLSYDRYLGKSAFESRYGVLVRRGGSPDVEWIDLGPGKVIDEVIAGYAKGVRGGGDSELETACRSLYQKLLEPVFPGGSFGDGADRPIVYVSGDAGLHQVSFATLLSASGRLAGEDARFLYLSSARDLANLGKGSFDGADLRNAELLCLGDPVFGDTPSGSEISLEPLPGTREEATRVFQIARDAGMEGKLLLGGEATEAGFRAHCESASLIHLATHGFGGKAAILDILGMKQFAKLRDLPAESVSGAKGGIALAGAGETIETPSAASGEGNSDPGDGWLTPADFREFDLGKVRLLCLSACDTGVGTAIRGEGIFGLRRAATLAGADNLLLSLWPIPDEATSELMTGFYADLFENSDRPASEVFLDRQRVLLKAYREKNGPVWAARLVGGFIWVSGAGE